MNEKIKEIIAETLSIELETIQEDANIMDDLGADSIAIMEIVMELEGEFDLEVPTEDVMNLHTVQDIAAYINDKK